MCAQWHDHLRSRLRAEACALLAVSSLCADIRFSNHVHKTDLELADFTSYMFWEVPKAKLASREASIERVYAFHASKYFREIEPLQGAQAGLDVLKERFELHVVTSRQTELEQHRPSPCACTCKTGKLVKVVREGVFLMIWGQK